MRISMVLGSLALLAGACSSNPSNNPGDDDPDAGGGANCGNGQVDEGEACDDGNDNRFDGCLPGCVAVDPIDAPALTWTYLEIPGTSCIDGSPSGFSVNPNPDSDQLVIYLEGGGACFNGFCESIFTWSGNTPSPAGIFDRDNPANPVADWNMVYVPYCTGDVYGGDKETMVAGEVRHFRGYPNFTAFLERWVPSFDGVGEVLLTGSSAGGFGAAINFPQTQDAFGAVPVTLIDDSGPPLGSDIFPPCLQRIFREVWGFDDTLLAECGADCDDPDDFIFDYLDHTRLRFPDMHFGLISSMQDTTIRSFAGYGWSGGWNMCAEFPTSVTGAVYEQGLMDLRDHLVDVGGGFGTYYKPGTSHTVLRNSGLYSAGTGGMSPAQWITATIAGDAAHLGP